MSETTTETSETTPQETPADLRAAADRGRAALAKNAELERELAIYRAGLGELKPTQVRALLGAHEGELTAEALKATAVDLGFAQPDAAAEEDLTPEIQTQQRISAAATGAGRAQATTTLKPADVETWPTDKLMRLNREHPDIFERLMRGEEIAGFAYA